MTRIVAGRPAQKYDEQNESAFRRETELASLRTDTRLSTLDIRTATIFPVAAFGAVGDGVTDDSAALEAAVTTAAAVNGTVTFQPGASYLLSRTIYGAESIRWQFNDTTFLADDVSGTYDDILDNTGTPTGFQVFFATDGGLNSIYSGHLWLDGNQVPNLCGISGSSAGTHAVQRWEFVNFRNLERGIFALNQLNGNTLVGHSFGTVDFRQCGTDIWLDGSGSDDLVFDVIRSHGSTLVEDAGKSNVHLEFAFGVVMRSLFIRGQRSDRHGLNVTNRSSLVCDHMYLEGDFDLPLRVAGNRNHLWARDIKVSISPFTSTNGQVVDVSPGADSCVLDLTFNDRVAVSTNVTDIVRINTDNMSDYGRTITVRMAFLTTDKNPILYTGVGPSDDDHVVVYAQDGTFRYFYDGSVLSTLREPLVNGTTTAVAGAFGDVAHEMEVFDSTGTSLGFVPIYDAVGAGGPTSPLNPLSNQGATYTLQLSDAGKTIDLLFNSGTRLDITIPANSSVAFPVGTEIRILNADTASAAATETIRLVRDTGVALRPIISGGSDDTDIDIGPGRGGGIIYQRATDVWWFIPFGDLTNISEVP